GGVTGRSAEAVDAARVGLAIEAEQAEAAEVREEVAVRPQPLEGRDVAREERVAFGVAEPEAREHPARIASQLFTQRLILPDPPAKRMHRVGAHRARHATNA